MIFDLEIGYPGKITLKNPQPEKSCLEIKKIYYFWRGGPWKNCFLNSTIIFKEVHEKIFSLKMPSFGQEIFEKCVFKNLLVSVWKPILLLFLARRTLKKLFFNSNNSVWKPILLLFLARRTLKKLFFNSTIFVQKAYEKIFSLLGFSQEVLEKKIVFKSPLFSVKGPVIFF